MDKTKLKELLNNPELDNLLKMFNNYEQICSFETFIKSKRRQLEETYQTSDNYKVKEGEYIYIVDSLSWRVDRFDPRADYKQFKTKENAQEHFIENAIVFSYNDVKRIRTEYSHLYNGFCDGIILKEKAKEKLGL